VELEVYEFDNVIMDINEAHEKLNHTVKII